MVLAHLIETAICLGLNLVTIFLILRGREGGVTLNPLGSPVVMRRPAKRSKPKVQDDLKAWQDEQKNA